MIAALLLMIAAAGSPEDIAALFRQARQAEQRRDFAAALENYDRVLAIDSRIAEVWANKGLVLHEMERHREALHAFEKAAELKPSLLVPQLFRGLERLRLGDPARAIGPLEAALELSPGHAEASNALAHACLQTGQFKRAVGLFRSIIARDPSAERPYYGLAVAYLNWSKVTARKLVDAASPYGTLLVAEYLAATGLDEPAAVKRRAAERALAREKPAADRALYEFSIECRVKARQALAEAVARNPGSFRAHLLSADLARNSGDDLTAMAEYEQAARLAPHETDVQLTYIRFLAPRDPSAALDYARVVGARRPADPELNSELGRLLLKSDSVAEALVHFRRALDADPVSPAARAGLAESLAKTGEFEAAIREMERAVQADPDGSWHYRLAGWYRSVGRTDQARAAFAATARLKAEQRRREQESFLALTSALELGPAQDLDGGRR